MVKLFFIRNNKTKKKRRERCPKVINRNTKFSKPLKIRSFRKKIDFLFRYIAKGRKDKSRKRLKLSLLIFFHFAEVLKVFR